MDFLQPIIVIAIVIFSIVLHEVAHGYAANHLGDPTARLLGRLTLNPLPHLDIVGSIIIPAITWFSGGFIFGWAKPVPYNPYNLQGGKYSEAYVAAAGPATNILLALIFGLIIRFGGMSLPQSFYAIAILITVVNLALTVFNLIPVPPLDGSKILASVLPPDLSLKYLQLQRYGLIFVFVIVILAWQFISPVISFLFSLITGISF